LKAAVIILNWNTRHYLETFIPPLLKSIEEMEGGVEVIVADNKSSDGSVKTLKTLFPQIRVIELQENFGFTGGYNRAIKAVLEGTDAPEYVVLLNSDVYVEKGWIAPLLSQMDSHPECAVCGPKFLSLRKDGDSYSQTDQFEYAGAAGGYIDRYGFPFCRGRVLSRTERDGGQYDRATPCKVLWVSGACLMTRTAVWKELGGLDERFFAHCEEIDYCWRAYLGGYSVCTVTKSRVFHLGGGTLPQGSPFKLRLNYRNSLFMLQKNLSPTFGKKRAETILRRRLLIDNCAALVYLLCGKLSSFKAVRLAHKEFKALKNSIAEESAAHPCRQTASVSGIADTCIIVQAALRGGKIFEYLKKYENSN